MRGVQERHPHALAGSPAGRGVHRLPPLAAQPGPFAVQVVDLEGEVVEAGALALQAPADLRALPGRGDDLHGRVAESPGELPELAGHPVVVGVPLVVLAQAQGGQEATHTPGVVGGQPDVVKAKNHCVSDRVSVMYA
ncbi:hypothetical protein EES44_27125 [Streptomyces sp. ADI96-15]|nr:hypothetical protein EES44_27125 [Streptomyces sp. ADI96-15]